MKKLIVILAGLLLLSGCGAQDRAAAPTGTEAVEETAQEVLVSLYDPNSDIEVQTSGAVRAYPLGDGIYTDLVTMNDKLLVVSASGDVTMLQGLEGQIVATEATDLVRTESGLPMWTSDQGAAYFAPQSAEVVLLDEKLLEIARIPLPEGIQGAPVVLLQRNEIFYCTDQEIRAVDIQTGISRRVRSHSCTSQCLTGAYFNDTVLGCRITDQQGTEKVVYLYADTGTAVQEDSTMGFLHTQGTAYYAVRNDGSHTQVLFGDAESETMCLETDPQGLTPALAMGGAVRCLANETGLELEYYDFATGTRSGAVSIAGLTAPIATASDDSGFWFIVDQMLYRWEPAQSPTKDDTPYAAQLYTQQNPDVQGLASCQKRAEELKAYGVDLRIWTDATADTGAYACEPEYRVSFTNNALDALEEVLKQFPENFLTTTGNIRLCIVRSVTGEQPVQYWQGNTCCIIVSGEQAAEGFLWGLGYGIDARVLGNSRELDTWNDLNPRGFEYAYDYASNAAREDAEDYQDSFVDQRAMSFPTEDRARVFMAAMQADNAQLFEQTALQKKLLRLCEGIREAYNLEDSTTVFPWEQYLKEPLAAEE